MREAVRIEVTWAGKPAVLSLRTDGHTCRKDQSRAMCYAVTRRAIPTNPVGIWPSPSP